MWEQDYVLDGMLDEDEDDDSLETDYLFDVLDDDDDSLDPDFQLNNPDDLTPKSSGKQWNQYFYLICAPQTWESPNKLLYYGES